MHFSPGTASAISSRVQPPPRPFGQLRPQLQPQPQRVIRQAVRRGRESWSSSDTAAAAAIRPGESDEVQILEEVVDLTRDDGLRYVTLRAPPSLPSGLYPTLTTGWWPRPFIRPSGATATVTSSADQGVRAREQQQPPPTVRPISLSPRLPLAVQQDIDRRVRAGRLTRPFSESTARMTDVLIEDLSNASTDAQRQARMAEFVRQQRAKREAKKQDPKKQEDARKK